MNATTSNGKRASRHASATATGAFPGEQPGKRWGSLPGNQPGMRLAGRRSGTTVRQRGQILPLTLAGVAVGAVILLLLGNIGNKVTEKSIAVDAADAAAISGATWVAQHLNFMAYTNRAMIANHVGVGHFTAYMSWIRYVDDAIDNFEDVVQFIPYVGAAAGALETFADALRELAEFEGELFVPAVDGLNAFYHAAQEDAHDSLGIPDTVNIPGAGDIGNGVINTFLDTPMDKLMQSTGESFDPDISINDFGDIAKIDTAMALPLLTLLTLQNPRIDLFVTPREVTGRFGAMQRLLAATYGSELDANGVVDKVFNFLQQKGSMSSDWLNDRTDSTTNDLLGIFNVKKEAKTEHTLNDELADWEASDKLIFENPFGAGDKTLAKGEAKASEFDSDYKGIAGWYDLTLPIPGHQFLPIIAYASKPQSGAQTAVAFDLDTGDEPLSAIAIAYVEHRRPDEGFDPLIALPVPIPFLDDVEANGEFANLFNPFWEARIVGTHFSDLKKANPLANLIDGIF